VVLNDGETFSDIDGAKVVEIEVPDHPREELFDETGFIEEALAGNEGADNIRAMWTVAGGKKLA
jgi:hypothetical protein